MPQQLPPSFTPDFYEKHWANVARKYDILGEHSKADLMRAQTDAGTLPGLREAQGFNLRAGGQESLERAGTESKIRQFYDNPNAVDMLHNMLLQGGRLPIMPGMGAPGAGAPMAPTATPTDTATSVSPPVAAPAPAPTDTLTPAPTHPPIQFLQLPSLQEQQGRLPAPAAPAAPPVDLLAPAAPAPQGSLTLPMTPQTQTAEQLTQGVQNAAARRRQQQPQLPLPTLTRPLRSQGFRRGTANVKGYAKGDEDISAQLLRPVLPFTRGPGAGVVKPGAMGDTAPAPAPAPTPGLGPMPAPTPGLGPMPAPTPDLGPMPAPSPMGTPVPSAWPGGATKGVNYDPNATTGVENLGGIVDAATRVANPDRFNAALQSFNPVGNIEDRRGETYTPPSALGQFFQNIKDNLANEVGAYGTAIFGNPAPAAPGSLGQQAGANDIIQGSRFGPLLNTVSSPFAAPTAPTAPVMSPTALVASTPLVAPAAPAPSSSSNAPEPEASYRKGSANVKGKGNKGSKGDKASKAGSPPKGLEAMLPMLLAAMQGGGAPGPAGPPAGAPPAPPGAGLKKGSANVKGGKSSKPSKPSKPSKSDDQPGGLEALLSALAGGGAGAAGPQAGPSLPPAMAPGAAAPPGFALGTPDAGYLLGATAVPGLGSGTTDTVPAMLAPHEAVLNRAAADMLGRGLIAALNAHGVRQMGMQRGAPS